MLEGKFQQARHIQVLTKPMESSGRFVAEPNHGLKWVTQEPVESVQILLPDGRIFDGQSGQFLELNAATITVMLMNVVTGNLQGMEDRFELIGQGDRILLYPKDEQIKAFVASIEVSVDMARKVVKSAVLHDADGNSTHIQFSGLTVSDAKEAVAASQFKELYED